MPCRTELVLVHPGGTRDPRGTCDWLRARTVDRHHHIAVGRDDYVDRVARLLLGRGIGVVLSGGGARGFAAVGVLRALEELGIPIDAVGGASVGAIIAVGVARVSRPIRSRAPSWRGCRDLAPYKVPVRFEPLDALPRNEIGKVLTRQLATRGT